jgi:hypothetical protein
VTVSENPEQQAADALAQQRIANAMAAAKAAEAARRQQGGGS